MSSKWPTEPSFWLCSPMSHPSYCLSPADTGPETRPAGDPNREGRIVHTTSYNHAHDRAQLLARRHERDLHWAKERRREQEREAAEARALLAASPLRLARGTLWAAGAALVATAGLWAGALALAGPAWAPVVDAAATALALGVLVAAVVAFGRIRARREHARTLLRARQVRLSHTQYHIQESVHSYIDARVDVVNSREPLSA